MKLIVSIFPFLSESYSSCLSSPVCSSYLGRMKRDASVSGAPQLVATATTAHMATIRTTSSSEGLRGSDTRRIVLMTAAPKRAPPRDLQGVYRVFLNENKICMKDVGDF